MGKAQRDWLAAGGRQLGTNPGPWGSAGTKAPLLLAEVNLKPCQV